MIVVTLQGLLIHCEVRVQIIEFPLYIFNGNEALNIDAYRYA